MHRTPRNLLTAVSLPIDFKNTVGAGSRAASFWIERHSSAGFVRARGRVAGPSFEFNTRRTAAPYFFVDALPADAKDIRLSISWPNSGRECASIHNAATYFCRELKNGTYWRYTMTPSITSDIRSWEFYPAREGLMWTEEDAAIYGSVVTGIYQFHDLMLGRLSSPSSAARRSSLLLSDHGFR